LLDDSSDAEIERLVALRAAAELKLEGLAAQRSTKLSECAATEIDALFHSLDGESPFATEAGHA
jgi:hypothetical protein